MRCEYMVDDKVQIAYARVPGNPLGTERVRLSRNAISADEELELSFRTFGEFERFVKFLHGKMWEQINTWQDRKKITRGAPRRKGRSR